MGHNQSKKKYLFEKFQGRLAHKLFKQWYGELNYYFSIMM